MLLGPETQLYRCAGHFDSERTGRHRCVYACMYICGLSTHARRYVADRHHRRVYAYRVARRSPPALRIACPWILWCFYARCCLRRQRDIRVSCTQVKFDLHSFSFLSDLSCNIQLSTSFFARLSPATFVFVFASASLINFGLE